MGLYSTPQQTPAQPTGALVGCQAWPPLDAEHCPSACPRWYCRSGA